MNNNINLVLQSKVDEIRNTFNSLKWAVSNGMLSPKKSENEQYEFLSIFKNFIYRSIHEDLDEDNNDKNGEKEKLIRELVKYVIKTLLPAVRKKTDEYSYKIQNKKTTSADELQMANNWLDLEDDYSALSAFRSLTCLALYLERDDASDQLVWKYIMKDVMGGIFYYANAMILNNQYQNMFKQCPTGFGKCLSKNTKILCEKGVKEIKDIKIGDYVYSMNDKNELVLQKVTNKWETRKKQVKIVARSGQSIIASPEHRMYTQRGYVQAKDLTKNDYFYSNFGKINGNKEIDENELAFISLMIFEGSCTESFISFTQEDNEVMDFFKKTCDKLNFTYGISKKDNNNKASTLWFHKISGKVQELLKKYNIYGCNAYTKRLPNQFYLMPLKQKYKFIGYMLATDGYIPKYNGFDLLGVSLANENLIDDIQLLLSTCGIYSKKSYKKVKNGEKEFDSWRLEIPDEYFEIIYKNCYCYHKQERLENRHQIINSKKVKCYCIRTNYPKEILENCKEFKRENNKQWKRNKSFKREIVENFNNRTHLLDNIVYKDFYWNEIVDINYIDEEVEMVDIEVENTHNFIANGFVSHNSKSDCVIICYIFGYNPNASVFKVVGNPSVAGDVFENVVKMLRSKRFGKVFPKFGKCEGNDRKMFKMIKQSDGEFLLNGSKKARSFFCVNKETSIDGTRYDYQFYDDVTQSKDRENVNQHKKDIKNYTGQWRKRASNEYDVKRFFTGTAYHSEDFISYLKKLYANGRPLIKDISTMMFAWSKFVKLSEDKKSVYVIVPKLADLDLGEEKCYCTFPQKFSKEVAIQMLHGNLGDKREFYAMEQQAPLPPESLIFDWAYLNTYNELPQDILDNDCECRAIIDPARKGNDFFCCLIFKKSNTINVDKWYLVDCFYQKVNAKKALPDIAKKIKKHMVDIIYLENNIDYEDLLDERLKDISYYDYEIISFYSTEKKSEKISTQQDDIRDLIIYPNQKMYYYESEMGKGLTELTTYSDEIKVAHDDFTDCCAMFTIQIQGDIENSVEVLNINFTFR